MNQFHQQKIEQIIAMSDSTEESQVSDELLAVIYSLGRDAQNEEEYAYAIEKLQMFCQWKNATVRTQAILAFSLLAVFHRHLNRTVVEPFILQEWLTATPENKCIIRDAVDDLNFALDWNLVLS